jgi:Transposase IS116/IS110/IS902 family
VRTGEALRARVSRPRAGPAGSLSRIGRRACSWRLPRSSCATGAPTRLPEARHPRTSEECLMPRDWRCLIGWHDWREVEMPDRDTCAACTRWGRAIGAASSHTRRASGMGATPRSPRTGETDRCPDRRTRPGPARPPRRRRGDRRQAPGHRRSQPQRLCGGAALAALCGASPVQASSGKTSRHRLNRGGGRAANNALWARPAELTSPLMALPWPTWPSPARASALTPSRASGSGKPPRDGPTTSPSTMSPSPRRRPDRPLRLWCIHRIFRMARTADAIGSPYRFHRPSARCWEKR